MDERVKGLRANQVVLVCPYCGAVADLVDSAKISKKSFGLIYLCSNYPMCDAYVVANRLTGLPLGSMANESLRNLRKKVSLAVNKLCWDLGMSRNDVYTLMRKWLGIYKGKIHIAMLSEEQCLKFIEIAGNYKPSANPDSVDNADNPFREYLRVTSVQEQ